MTGFCPSDNCHVTNQLPPFSSVVDLGLSPCKDTQKGLMEEKTLGLMLRSSSHTGRGFVWAWP